MLLQKALGQRECVDVELEAEGDAVTEVFLSLTYKFSPTISRRGLFQLPIVASDAPQSLVTLLTSVHAAPRSPCSLNFSKGRRRSRGRQWWLPRSGQPLEIRRRAAQ